MSKLKRILFIGNHYDLYNILADCLGVEAVCVRCEDQALALLPLVDGVVTGHVGRSSAWFTILSNAAVPCVVFSLYVKNQTQFELNFPTLTIVDKGVGSKDLTKLQCALHL